MPIETCSVDKPKPINTGPSQAEGIAKFACRVKHADLTAELFDLGKARLYRRCPE